MKNLPLLLATIGGTLILIFGIGYFFSQSETTPSEPAQVDPATVAGDARNAKGNLESDIVVVEYSDFQCPACASVEPLIDQFMAEYGEQVKLVYRHFPIDSIHFNARLAAQAAEAAAIDNKFWEYHQLLFDGQADWSNISDKNELKEKFAEYAQELEIDKDAFLERIESPSVVELVEVDKQSGIEAGVNGTPTFYVNGIETSAPQLNTAVDALIADQPEAEVTEEQQ